jgi:hypothetical protein
MQDIDLLVPRESLEKSLDLLNALGYDGHAVEYHICLRGGPRQSVLVELHSNLTNLNPTFPSPLDWFWKETELLGTESAVNTTGDRPVLVFTPTATLLYLAIHLARHKSSRLLWLYDIHLLIQRHANYLAWDELLYRAQQFNLMDALHFAIHRVQICLGTILPDSFVDTLNNLENQRKRFEIGQHIVEPTRIQNTWDTLTALQWKKRLRVMFAAAVPQPTQLRLRYQPRPTWLWPLYYPYRWWCILRDGISTLYRKSIPPSPNIKPLGHSKDQSHDKV